MPARCERRRRTMRLRRRHLSRVRCRGQRVHMPRARGWRSRVGMHCDGGGLQRRTLTGHVAGQSRRRGASRRGVRKSLARLLSSSHRARVRHARGVFVDDRGAGDAAGGAHADRATRSGSGESAEESGQQRRAQHRRGERVARRDAAGRYRTALGSARETGACLDVAVALGYVDEVDARVLSQLDEVRAMLAKRVR
jgi:hypothetical protein